MAEKVNVFISYSHKNKKQCSEMIEHLSSLEHEEIIAAWTDRDIPPGAEWAEEISKALEQADLILLLISSGFIGSKFCYSVEMKRAIERHDARTATVIPIAIADCDWGAAPFAKLQGLPPDLQPIMGVKGPKRDTVYKEVVAAIRQTAKSVAERKQSNNAGATIRMRSIEDRYHDLQQRLSEALFRSSTIITAVNAACSDLGIAPIIRTDDPKIKAVERLLALPFQSALDLLRTTLAALKRPDDIDGIRTVARNLIPYLFAGSTETPVTKNRWEFIGGNGLISLKAGNESFADIVAAGLDMRPSTFAGSVKNPRAWPNGQCAVDDWPTAGPDGLIEDEKNFRAHLWSKASPPNAPMNLADDLKDKAINKQFEAIAKDEGVRYYVILNEYYHRDDNLVKNWERWMTEKYPSLHLIKLDPTLYLDHQDLFNDIRNLLSESAP